MYKWPQGRVIRTISLILTLLVVADLGYTGAFAQFSTWIANTRAAQLGGTAAAGGASQILLGSLFSALALGALVAGLVLVGFHKRSVEFLIAVEHEMVRVEWPTVNHLWRSTLVIALIIVLLGAVIFAADVLLALGLNALTKLGGG